MMKWICLLVLLVLSVVAAAEEDFSSAELVQLAVDTMGDANQNAQVSDFDNANSMQIGYSSNSNVTQVIYYDNVRNGSIMQWGESGNMGYAERWRYVDRVGESGLTVNWENGKVNQTIYLKNSERLSLLQKIGDLRRILFPDENQATEEQDGTWTFCGKARNGRGGLPLCAEVIGERIFAGKATPHDYYMLQNLEWNYNVFPPENLTPHVMLVKWNVTKVNGNLTLKFLAHNFGRQKYNATLMLDFTPAINITAFDASDEIVKVNGKGVELRSINLDGEIKVPEKQTIEVGRYTVPSMYDLEKEVVVPLNGIKVSKLEMRMIS